MKKASWFVIVAIGGALTIGCSDEEDGAGGGTSGTAGSGGTAGAGGGGGAGAGMAGMAGMPMAPPCADIPSQAMGSGFTVSSAEYANCAPIPAVHTCDAKPFPQGSSPSVTWTAGPSGTMSYAVVFKDIAVLARTPSTEAAYNRGYHYVIWDIPATVMSLPANMMGGHLSTEVAGARQWSNFNNYGYFGPCPNFDPAMPTNFDDSYSFVVYALPFAKATVPAQQMGISTVRLLDDTFKTSALAVAEHRGTSSAHSSEVPAGILPPMPMPPCPTDGSAMPAGCLAGP